LFIVVTVHNDFALAAKITSRIESCWMERQSNDSFFGLRGFVLMLSY
jgi:hypothetical protein